MDYDPRQRDFLKALLGTAASAMGLVASESPSSPLFAHAARTDLTGGTAGPSATNLIAQAAGVLPTDSWIDVRAHGAIGDGSTDDTAAIQRAIDAAPVGGATIFFPSEYTFRCAGTLVLDDRSRLRLLGGGVGVANPANVSTRPNLVYSGGGKSFLSMRSVASIGLQSLCAIYTDPAFAGDFVDLDWSARSRDSGLVQIHDCSFGGLPPAINARSLLRLNNVVVVAVRDCWFGHAHLGILGGSPGYSNVVQVGNCAFKNQSDSAIKNAGQSWTIQGCTFEHLLDGGGVAYVQDAGRYAWGLNFTGNWCGDATRASTWVTTQALGLNFSGNRFESSGPGSVCLRVVYSEGISISGNHFGGSVGIDVAGFAIGLSVIGNKFFGVPVPVRNWVATSAGSGAFLGNSGLLNQTF